MKKIAVLALALALGAGAAQAQEKKASMLRGQVRSWRAAHEKEIVGELAGLLALRNVASDREDILRNADHLMAMLRQRGFATRLLTAGDAPPAVYAELSTPGARRTVVFYAHYDGQPAKAADWDGDPWTPVLRTGVRGAPNTRDVDLASATARSIPSGGSTPARRATTRVPSWPCSPRSTP